MIRLWRSEESNCPADRRLINPRFQAALHPVKDQCRDALSQYSILSEQKDLYSDEGSASACADDPITNVSIWDLTLRAISVGQLYSDNYFSP